MPAKIPSLFKIYALSTVVSLLLVALVGFQLGLGALFLVLILIVLEITFSVDNAVINTKILQRLSPAWQQAFLTIGIIIAVIGVRVFLPLFIVSIASGISIGSVIDLALNHPEEYGHKLEDASVVISAFGGTFLLMIFLDFFFQKRQTKWLVGLENIMQKIGRLPGLSIVLSLGTLFILSSFLDDFGDQKSALTSGVIGLVAYLMIHSLDKLMNASKISKSLQQTAKHTLKAGLIGFIYLNVIDASFSLDGVIGAFAITDQVLLIAVGLGVGALYVRVLTIHMLRYGVLQKYRYLEHGAHYAIGILALLMLASLLLDVPQAVAGLAGIVVVGAAFYQSNLNHKRET